MTDIRPQKTEPLTKPLRIVVVGGHKRSMQRLVERGRIAGWKIERHSEEIKGRGVEDLRFQIGRSDIVVITARVNSHGSMFLAKEWARRLGRLIIIIRRENFEELEATIARFRNGDIREPGTCSVDRESSRRGSAGHSFEASIPIINHSFYSS